MSAAWLAALFFLPFVATSAEAKLVRYELIATKGKVNMSGKETVDFALMMNGSIPAPVLEFTEGDDAEIVVKNRIEGQELSVHWHGILLPPEMDGVAYVNSPPILEGTDFTFRFRIRQHGTYWYHSHTDIQEQKGLYGAIVIHPKARPIPYDRDAVAVISDWSDEDATSILKNLRKDGDYYLYKKGTMRSWVGAIAAGSLGNFLYNEWTRMGGMDYSDVGYDAFLINGKTSSQLIDAKPGERVRLRIINAAASTYFHVALGASPMKVISADGVDVQPTMAQEILMGMAETYDVLFTVPHGKNHELRITAQDGTGAASAWIGAASGEKVAAPVKPMPDMYATMDHGSHGGHGGPGAKHGDHSAPAEHGGHAGHAGHSTHSGSHEAPTAQTLTVDNLSAQAPTAFPPAAPVHDVKLVLGGDMRRYIWHINGKAIHQDRTIEIKEGDVVRFTFENQTMMHHPMHLHGHFFRVVNASGERSPLKHTVDVPPHGTRVIEFLANEPGEWMLHCHNLYHMKTGMARVVKYLSYKPKPEMEHWQKHDHHLHDHVYFHGMLEASSNHAQAKLEVMQTWHQLEFRVESANIAGKNFSFKDRWDYEGDLFYRRWFGQYFSVVGGATSFGREYSAALGVGYILPFLIEANVFVTHRGKFRLDLEKRFQWAKWVFTDVDFTLRPDQKGEHMAEFEASFMFSPVWAWAAGLMVTNDSFGGGVQFQF